MKKNLLSSFLNIEYVFASLLVLALIVLLGIIDDNLPEADDTSFLSPLLDRIDFLNIEDVSIDAIFAIKDMQFMDKRIVVVNLGEVAPTPDGKIAMLLYKLHSYGVKVVGLDVIFDAIHFERFPKEREGEISAIKQALADVPDVVLVHGFDVETMKPELEIDPDIKRSVHNYGYANLFPDGDQIIRRFYPYRAIEGRRWLSFPVKMLQVYDSSTVSRILQFPEEPQIISYAGTYDQIQTFPIDDIVNDFMYGDEFVRTMRMHFKDAIVLVGFVNEGGLFYLGDTHKTPLGRKIGIEGPDMPGILVHANIVNMLLNRKFIEPVSPLMDWLLAFLLTYISIALYRVLRTKAVSDHGVGYLITSMLVLETLIVFFIPIIGFFYLNVKISYNLMATAVLLFIPASALTTKLRFKLITFRMKRTLAEDKTPLTPILMHAFETDDSFPANLRLTYAAEVLLHFAMSVELARKRTHAGSLPFRSFRSFEKEWSETIPAVSDLFVSKRDADAERRHFFRFLSGKKIQFLRDWELKSLLFSTQLGEFNAFFYFEEWEVLLPKVREMFVASFHNYLHEKLFAIVETSIHGIAVEAPVSERVQGTITINTRQKDEEEGLYLRHGDGTDAPVRISPFCELAECKQHRRVELFVFAAMVPRQYENGETPVYFGETFSCEPILPIRTIRELQQLKRNATEM